MTSEASVALMLCPGRRRRRRRRRRRSGSRRVRSFLAALIYSTDQTVQQGHLNIEGIVPLSYQDADKRRTDTLSLNGISPYTTFQNHHGIRMPSARGP